MDKKRLCCLVENHNSRFDPGGDSSSAVWVPILRELPLIKLTIHRLAEDPIANLDDGSLT